MREKLELVELRSETLTRELRVLKAMKGTQDEYPARNTSAGNKVLTTNKNKTEGEDGIRQAQDQRSANSTPIPFNSGGTSRMENGSYASVAVSKPTPSPEKPEKPWTQVNHGNQKSTRNQHRTMTNPD